MAEAIPLLHPATARANALKPHEEYNGCNGITGLDEVIERCVGGIGPAQLFQVFLVSVVMAFDAQQIFIVIFTDAVPSWRCTSDGLDNGACSSFLPSPCGLPEGTWKWERPAHVSVVSEWSVQCAGSFLSGLPASAFFAGSLVGMVALGSLADTGLGRKKMLIFSCLGMGLAGLVTAASPDVWVYSALRFASGFSRSLIGACSLLLSTEPVGKQWRGQVGVVGYILFTVGFLSLPLLAYVERFSSWRMLYLWTSAPALLYSAVIYLFVHESPRWLLVRNRREEAIAVLKGLAASNGKEDADSFPDVLVVREEYWDTGTSTVPLYSSLKALIERRWALRRLALVLVVFFGIGMTYNGMPLALGTLGSNLYISVVLNAVSELPSSLLTFFFMGEIKRRSTVLGFSLASGACSVACVFQEEEGIRMVMQVVAFSCACTAFDVVLIYALELFPTSVRNSAQSLARPALVLGGVCAPPLIAVANGGGGRFMSFGVFGLVIASCGLFVVLLPETRGRRMCDTLEEEEWMEVGARSTSPTPESP